jgi:hypothetical protein
MLNTVIGRVFLHPVTKVEYGLIRVPSSPTTFSALDGVVFDVFAEHGCGNDFKTSKDGAVWFWDYETDELVLPRRFSSGVYFPLRRSPARGIAPGASEVRPDRPRLSEIRWQDLPKDGWVKKPSERK